MKKIFTLFAAMMLFVGGAPLNAQNEVDIPLDNWGWGFSCESSFADGVLTGTLTGNYGAVSTGWNDGVDWSAYSKLTVVIESYNNDWGKVYFSDVDGKTVAEVSFSTITKSTAVNLSFDDVSAESLKAVKQLAVQGKAAGDIIKISRVYLTEAVAYETEGKEIAFDEWGNILASEFEGYSDNAKVVFTYTTTGELTNAEGSIVGWGIGSISSIDKSVKVVDIPAKAIGDNEISFLLSDLKAALAAGPDEYSRYGLYWNMWPQGNSVNTRKCVMIYNVKGTGINAIEAAKPVQSDVMYNLSGQKVGAGYKGIVIKNGKKVLVK